MAQQLGQIKRIMGEQHRHTNLNLYGALEEKGSNLMHEHQSRCAPFVFIVCTKYLGCVQTKKKPRTVRQSGWPIDTVD